MLVKGHCVAKQIVDKALYAKSFQLILSLALRTGALCEHLIAHSELKLRWDALLAERSSQRSVDAI
jgi:hypothetical protein